MIRFSIVAGPRQRADLGQTAAEAWHDYVNDAVLAEELGYDAVYFAEHHFCFSTGNSSPLIGLTHVAARTKRIRLGTGLICAPFHNPLRLAEDIAAVDIASNGRFDLGIGVGSQWEEFQAFGIPPSERFARTWEIIDILELCLNSGKEHIEFKGKYYHFDKLRWIMQPVQKKIPFLWGGFGPQGVKKAAERGYHLIAPDFSGNYQRIMRECGRDPREYLIGFHKQCSIADSWEEAFQATAEPCLWVSNQYALRKDLEGNQPPESARHNMEQIREAAKRELQFTDYTVFAPPNPGTVDQMIEKYLPVVRGDHGLLTHIVIEPRAPGVKTKDVHRSMRLFAEKVRPVLEAEARKSGLL
jgi:alkanesulfonate monooxygenase SsuD/methylene tetrahydromethanopterin reductase-like flavin-dependent oxidoreductase (luciferase family)